MKTWQRIVLVLINSILCGCISAKVKIPVSEKTIKDVYEERVGKKDIDKLSVADGKNVNWIEQKGERKKIYVQPVDYHDNPTIEMLIVPHLNPKSRLIPAYIIPYKLFEKDQIRLPGE